MYASATAKRVSEKCVDDRQKGNLPCILEEVTLDSPQEISTHFVWAVFIEITKRVEMRKVIGFIALFLPTGLVVCASGPFVNAALDLISTYKPVKIQHKCAKS